MLLYLWGDFKICILIVALGKPKMEIINLLVAESFLEKPTAFGVPLGALLLWFWLMQAIKEKNK